MFPWNNFVIICPVPDGELGWIEVGRILTLVPWPVEWGLLWLARLSGSCLHQREKWPQSIPGGAAQISDVKDLKDARVVISTTPPLNFPVWPVWKTDGRWKVTADYQKLNQIMTLIAAAVPVVRPYLSRQASLGAWYAAIDLANAIFSVHKDERQFAYSW